MTGEMILPSIVISAIFRMLPSFPRVRPAVSRDGAAADSDVTENQGLREQ